MKATLILLSSVNLPELCNFRSQEWKFHTPQLELLFPGTIVPGTFSPENKTNIELSLTRAKSSRTSTP